MVLCYPPAVFRRGVLACRRESTHCAKPCPHCNGEVLLLTTRRIKGPHIIRECEDLSTWPQSLPQGGCLNIRSCSAPLHARPQAWAMVEGHGSRQTCVGVWRSRTYENGEDGRSLRGYESMRSRCEAPWSCRSWRRYIFQYIYLFFTISLYLPHVSQTANLSVRPPTSLGLSFSFLSQENRHWG